MSISNAGRPRIVDRNKVITTPTAFVVSLEIKELIDLYSIRNNISRSELIRIALLEKFEREGFVK